MSATATTTAPPPTTTSDTSPRPQPPKRQSTLDEAALAALEKKLGERPEKSELQERNILKDDKVAPALQAAKEKLERSQLEDKLDNALQKRPKPEELVKEGILQADEAPTI
ncbi:uncharacterized protein STEHIDRAFT_125364 [Stereum hirsutum FP-91666 SS1]|uniref:uncharacterized protein n=1 Tax=Stereum hirsutum (strain FP-91666) TaxID=721885 RepID=UPI000444A49C|nr:uncharacterized protein STEHIDRAFT_125364 [Stereum hirsutum FP-91666 SS1]EIM81095.1 hypothetical protein STEHIDRAFT_125364 [Stereum hirsutum FP-91666 SS1]